MPRKKAHAPEESTLPNELVALPTGVAAVKAPKSNKLKNTKPRVNKVKSKQPKRPTLTEEPEELIEVPKAKVVKVKADKPAPVRKTNAWLQHVAQERKKHPDKTYKEVLSLAKPTYKKN
jgi:hypothetical protein